MLSVCHKADIYRIPIYAPVTLQISAALTASTMAQKQQRPVITGPCAIVGSTAVAPTTKNVWLLATR